MEYLRYIIEFTFHPELVEGRGWFIWTSPIHIQKHLLQLPWLYPSTGSGWGEVWMWH